MGFSMRKPLPAHRCALTTPFHPYRKRRFIFCGTFPKGFPPAGNYPASYLHGARTFLEKFSFSQLHDHHLHNMPKLVFSSTVIIKRPCSSMLIRLSDLRIYEFVHTHTMLIIFFKTLKTSQLIKSYLIFIYLYITLTFYNKQNIIYEN